MKTTAASLLMFFLVLTTVVSGQTPYQAYFDYSGAYTNSITDVNAVLRNTNLDWVVVGSANEPYNNAADMYPVIYAIQHNNPGTVIITPTTIQVSLDPTKPVKFVCKDIVEFQGSNFAICGSVEYDGASGGTAGFLLIVDGNHTPLALYIYDNLLTINSLIFNGQYDKIILVGQSFQDSYGATWNSLPCVMVVDGGSPDNIISSYVCEDGSPSHNEGEYNDIDYVTNNQYVIVGKYKVVESSSPLLTSWDVLISGIEIDQYGAIVTNEDIILRACTDLSDEIGEGVVVASPTEFFICGESWDPPTQANPVKHIMALRVVGAFQVGNLATLTYYYREVDFGYNYNDIFAPDIDYQASSFVLSITGNYASAPGEMLPYILQVYNFTVSVANEFSWNSTDKYYPQRTFLLNTNPRILSFGTYEISAGNSNVLTIGDDTWPMNVPVCKTPLNVQVNACDPVFLHNLGIYPHDDNVTVISTFITLQPQLNINAMCNTPVFDSPSGYEVKNDVGIENADDEIHVYVNAASSTLNISNIEGEFSIYNSLGQHVYCGVAQGNTQVEMSIFSPGVYFLAFKDVAYSTKFIREK